MRHYSFDKLSLDRFVPVKIEVSGGSRPRLILKNLANNQRYFLKTYRHNTREIWAEMFAAQLGKYAGFHIQAVSLKKFPGGIDKLFLDKYGTYLPEDWQPVGALVRNVFPKDHEQLYGAQIIGTATEPVTLEQIEESIRKRYLDSEDILQDFADMVLFDAWIGNMDRHHENWAISQKNVTVQMSLLGLSRRERDEIKKRRKFTTLFDHGSSLLFELDDQKVGIYNANRGDYERDYILGRKYALLLASDVSHKNTFEIIREHIGAESKWARRFRSAMKKIACVDDLEVARMILEMPTDGELAYSGDRKKLLYYSLRRRREILQEILEVKRNGN